MFMSECIFACIVCATVSALSFLLGDKRQKKEGDKRQKKEADERQTTGGDKRQTTEGGKRPTTTKRGDKRQTTQGGKRQTKKKERRQTTEGDKRQTTEGDKRQTTQGGKRQITKKRVRNKEETNNTFSPFFSLFFRLTSANSVDEIKTRWTNTPPNSVDQLTITVDAVPFTLLFDICEMNVDCHRRVKTHRRLELNTEL